MNTTAISALASRLHTLLTEESATLRSAVALLRAEHEVLMAGDVDTLGTIAKQKTELYAQLNRLGEARRLLLARSGCGAERRDVERFLGAHVEFSGCLKQFSALLALAEEAQAGNKANGLLISTLMRSNQQTLAVLMSASQRAATYGPDGQQHSFAASRSLGCA